MNERACTRCGLTTPEVEFYPRSDTGKQRSHCRPCINLQNAEWRNSNRERMAFLEQRNNAKRRGVQWAFHSFSEWRAWWVICGYDFFPLRGRDGLCMARYGDTGPYSATNTYCTTTHANLREHYNEVRHGTGNSRDRAVSI
jgi:hypothetical protein